MAFIDTIKERAKADKKTIVLPESMDRRTFEAAEKILKEGIANLIIIGTPEEIAKNSEGFDISGATIVDPFNDPNKQKYIDKFVELRAKKGMTPELAKEQMEKDYMYYACLMCKCGDADGAVSGACHSTGNTIRPALQLLKTKPGISSVSGFFLMEVPDCEYGENGLFVFADCAVSPDYDSEKLAEVAKLSADSFKSFVGKDAKVAMLSFSSYGSAKHDRVTMVADAVKIAKEKYPDITVDGELQLDDGALLIDFKQGLLDGVCITGGEPLLYKELPEFLKKVRELGFAVKVDTNGSFPQRLEDIINQGLCDYVAVDIKNSREKYGKTVGLSDFDISPVEKTVELLKRNLVPYEFRTTVVKELHEISDIENIAKWIAPAENYFLQQFNDSGNLIGRNLSAHLPETLEEMRKAASKYIPNVQIRGTEI